LCSIVPSLHRPDKEDRAARAEAERGAALVKDMIQEELVAPEAPVLDIDFSEKEKKQGAGGTGSAGPTKLSRLERWVKDVPIKMLSYLLAFMDGPALGGLTTGSKNLYMKVKSSVFLLHVTLKSMARISNNARRGVGYGMITGCQLAVGVPDERCNVKTVTSITQFFTSAYPMGCTGTVDYALSWMNPSSSTHPTR